MAEPTDDQILQEQIGRLAELVSKLVEGGGNSSVTTVIHKQAGPGGLLAAAVTACILTWAGLIVLAILLVPDIHDMRAWIAVHSAKIAVLEGKNK